MPNMKYKFILPTLCMFGAMSLHAEGKGLGSILQQVAVQKKILSEHKMKNTDKRTRFIFKDEYDSNGLGSKEKTAAEEKSKSYEYENKSRFKFRFNDGSGNNNFVAGQRSVDTGGSAGSVSAGGGRGQVGGSGGGQGGGRR